MCTTTYSIYSISFCTTICCTEQQRLVCVLTYPSLCTVYKSDESIVIFALFRQLLLYLQFILSTRLKFHFDLIFLLNLKVLLNKTRLRDITVCALYYFFPLNTLLYICLKYHQYLNLGSSNNIRKRISLFF